MTAPNGLALRMGHRIALKFEGHLATEIVVLPSISQAKRYVRLKGLVVREGEFKPHANCGFIRVTCKQGEGV